LNDRGFCTMIRKSMRRLVPLLILATVPVWGGSVSLSFNQHATRNLFQTSEPVADQVSVFSLALEKDLSALSLIGRADYTAFNQTTGLSFFAADAGLDYLAAAGRKSAFYFAAGGSGQFYGQAYAAFSSLGGHLVGAFKTYLTSASILKLQWQGRYVSYNDSLFDALSQSLSLSVDRYFASRTTLKAEAGWGYKYFLHPFLPELMEPTAPTVLLGAGGPGSGGGGMANGGTGGGWGGQQYQGGYGFVPRYSSEGGGAGIGNVSLSFLAAQGLGDAVGLSASYLRQWVVTGENPFASIEEFYYVQNPTSDSFSWEGYQVNGRITLELPWDLSLKTGYTYSDRSFPGVESFDGDGLPLGITRGDRQNLIEARLQKDFRRLTIFLSYSHIRNTSTDPMFVWRSPFFTAGIEWRLPTTGKRGAA
jgi:hypothetical protein